MSENKKNGSGGKRKDKQPDWFFPMLAVILVLIVTIIAIVVISGNVDKNKETKAAVVESSTEQESFSEKETESYKVPETESDTIPETKQEIKAETLPEIKPSDGKTKKVYLTFDDGPSENTDKVLDILKKYDVKATFFVVINEEEGSKERYKRIVDEGHTLAIHSASHNYQKIYADIDSFSNDVLAIQNYVYNITGYKPVIYRFPGGSSNSFFKQNVTVRQCIDWLTANGFTYYDWNVSSGDGNNVPPSVSQILNNIFTGSYSVAEKENPVVLMHDSASKVTTVEALPQIIERIKAYGYEIAPITSDSTPVHHRD